MARLARKLVNVVDHAAEILRRARECASPQSHQPTLLTEKEG
jgi:hypothetical protein